MFEVNIIIVSPVFRSVYLTFQRGFLNWSEFEDQFFPINLKNIVYPDLPLSPHLVFVIVEWMGTVPTMSQVKNQRMG
jgi:hypothetical protein